jgi:hypothetical protein
MDMNQTYPLVEVVVQLRLVVVLITFLNTQVEAVLAQ